MYLNDVIDPATGLPENPYPFSYPVYPSIWFEDGAVCPVKSECPPFPPVVSGNYFTFVDAPTNPTFSGADASKHPPVGDFVAFSTALVGVSSQPVLGTATCGLGSSSYCSTLYPWTWNSTFNGTAGSGVTQTASVFPINPGSGTGGITVTSINGVPAPSTARALATPTVTLTPATLSINPQANLSVTVSVAG